jgi:hypothetical protein
MYEYRIFVVVCTEYHKFFVKVCHGTSMYYVLAGPAGDTVTGQFFVV